MSVWAWAGEGVVMTSSKISRCSDFAKIGTVTNFCMQLDYKNKGPNDNEGWVEVGAEDAIGHLKNGLIVLEIGAETEFCTQIAKIQVSSSCEWEGGGGFTFVIYVQNSVSAPIFNTIGPFLKFSMASSAPP